MKQSNQNDTTFKTRYIVQVFG